MTEGLRSLSNSTLPPRFLALSRSRLIPRLSLSLLLLLSHHGGRTEKAARAAHGRYVGPARIARLESQANLKIFSNAADQLIGTGAASRNAQLSITDSKVCRSYLVGTCPHDLFTNTKQDLGPCPKVHSEGLKTEYETASAAEKAKWGFDYDYMRDMQKYIDDCDRRIDSAQRRLEKTPDEIRQTNNLVSGHCGG